ncbi:hypothetical protein ACWEK5_21310 [Rhodococcus koreensis]
MFERFSDHARRVVIVAAVTARAHHRPDSHNPRRTQRRRNTRADLAVRAAGQRLETWIHDRIADALEQPE